MLPDCTQEEELTLHKLYILVPSKHGRRRHSLQDLGVKFVSLLVHRVSLKS